MAIAIKPGMQFDMLTAVRLVSTKIHDRGSVEVWEFRCQCGSVVERRLDFLRKGSAKRSCGCHMGHSTDSHDKRPTPGARLVRERHVEGRSFGYAPSSGRCSLEYV